MRKKSHVFTPLLICAIFLLLKSFAFAQSGQGPLNNDDRSFILTEAGNAEMAVRLGELATTRAASEDVMKFGHIAIGDFSKANDGLRHIAQKKGVVIPAEMSERNLGMVQSLSGISGAYFDREYMNFVVEQFRKDMEYFKTEAEKAQDSDVKAFAAENLSVLERNLSLAEEIQHRLGLKATGK